MMIDPKAIEEVRRRFQPVRLDSSDLGRMEDIRLLAEEMAVLMATHIPNCRELSLALTHLEETVMFANAGIARTKEQ